MATNTQSYVSAEYVAHENTIEKIAQIIVDAGCKPYAAAQALLAAGYTEPPSV